VQKAILSVILCLLSALFGFQAQREPVQTPNQLKRNRILLIPLDSRPAAGQFAQMIGAMNNTTVEIPPLDLLGKFTVPGDVDKIYEWLESQNLDDVSAIIVSGDMLAYGGLIASRVNDVDAYTGVRRLQHKKPIPKLSFTFSCRRCA
jgi:hypothetical protein